MKTNATPGRGRQGARRARGARARGARASAGSRAGTGGGSAGSGAGGGRDDERRAWLALGPINVVLLVAGLAAVAVGYVLLERGSVTAAPALLTLGYVVLLPAGLLVGFRRSSGRGAQRGE